MSTAYAGLGLGFRFTGQVGEQEGDFEMTGYSQDTNYASSSQGINLFFW
jgi:hypothetical protein